MHINLILLFFFSITIFFYFFFFFFNDPATTEIYTLSLHDALPILPIVRVQLMGAARVHSCVHFLARIKRSKKRDRKSTRLNSSHSSISYAVFCLKKKKKNKTK